MKSLRVSFFLAWRSIVRSSYGVTAVTIIMVTLIYMSLLFLPSLIQGAVGTAQDQVVNTLTSNIVITPNNNTPSIDDASSYLSAIRKTQGVDSATAVYHVGTQIDYKGNSGNWTIGAIDPSSYAQVFTTPSHILEGRYLTTNDTNEIFLGVDIAGIGSAQKSKAFKGSLEGVHAGDTVTITLSNGKVEPFTVAGIYNDNFTSSDDSAFITQTEANTLLPISNDKAHVIYVKVKNGANINNVINALTPLHSNVKFETSDEVATAIQADEQTDTLISNIVGFVSLIMAAITIFIVTYVDLVSKRKQIGIERAIGIKSSAIVWSYLIKSLMYAIVGIVIGFILFKHVVVPLVQSHPFQFPNGPVTLATKAKQVKRAVGSLLVVALLAALIPAVQSVRIKILDAIWGK